MSGSVTAADVPAEAESDASQPRVLEVTVSHANQVAP